MQNGVFLLEFVKNNIWMGELLRANHRRVFADADHLIDFALGVQVGIARSKATNVDSSHDIAARVVDIARNGHHGKAAEAHLDSVRLLIHRQTPL